MTAIYVIHYRAGRYTGEQLHLNEGVMLRSISAGDVDGVIDRIDTYDPDEHTASTITEDVAIKLAQMAGRSGDPISEQVRDLIETHAGLEYARGLRVIDCSFAA